MSFKFIIAYFKHYLTANNRHGTHSPFVYKLADEVIYDFSSKKVYEFIENQRNSFLTDPKKITIADFSNHNTLKPIHLKKISLISKEELKTLQLAQLVYRLLNHLKPKNILTLDTSLSINTAYLAIENPLTTVLALEPCGEKALLSKQLYSNLELKNISLQIGSFDDLLPKSIATIAQLDFVYINGNITNAATLNYFNCCLPKLHQGSLVIIKGINKNKEMSEAWDAIKNNSKVTITINLFWLGLVYFRKGQAKEHFNLKF